MNSVLCATPIVLANNNHNNHQQSINSHLQKRSLYVPPSISVVSPLSHSSKESTNSTIRDVSPIAPTDTTSTTIRNVHTNDVSAHSLLTLDKNDISIYTSMKNNNSLPLVYVCFKVFVHCGETELAMWETLRESYPGYTDGLFEYS